MSDRSGRPDDATVPASPAAAKDLATAGDPPSPTIQLIAPKVSTTDPTAIDAMGGPPALGSSPPVASPWMFAAGQLLAGRYQIVRFLARGGMGEVYEAEDREVRQRVAIKAMLPLSGADPVRREGQLKRELLFGRKVTHPNVCRVFDVHHAQIGSGPDVATVPFVTMELLEGETLGDRIEKIGRFSPSEALPIVQQMVAGLAAAHAAGVVHRDFKPGNVILVDQPGAGAVRAVITDFGLARAIAQERMGESTTDFAGTPAYMAPEQILDRPVTPATDVYALGAVMFEMMTGERPFGGEQPLSSALKRLHEEPPSPRTRVPALDPLWDAVIFRCLGREPEDRFSSVAEVAACLQGEAAVPRSPRRGWRRAIVFGALAAAAFGSVVAVRSVRRGSSEPASTFVELPDGPVRSVLTAAGAGGSMVHGVARDRAGVTYLGGYVTSPVVLGTTAIDATSNGRTGYVAAVASAGEVVWHREVRSSHDAHVGAVVHDGRGAVVIAGARRDAADLGGGFTIPPPAEPDTNDCWLASLDDRTGTPRWIKTCGATVHSRIRALITDDRGNIYACGDYSGSATFGGSVVHTTTKGLGVFVVSYTPDGALRWVVAADRSGRGSTKLRALAIHRGELWFGGRVEQAMSLAGHDLDTHAPNLGLGVLGVLDAATGKIRKIDLLPGPKANEIQAIASVGDELAIAGGYAQAIELVPGTPHTSTGDWESFVAMVDPQTGVARRAWYAESTKWNNIQDLRVSPQGLLVLGRVEGSLVFDGHEIKSKAGVNGYAANIDGKGATSIPMFVGTDGDMHPRIATVTPDGSVLVAGRFRHSMNIDGRVMRSRGVADGVVLELRAPGRE